RDDHEWAARAPRGDRSVGPGRSRRARGDARAQERVRSASRAESRTFRRRPVTDARIAGSATHDAVSLDDLRKCVHCGICLPQCPTYLTLGEEMDSPRGRLYLMRAAAEGRITPSETFIRHLDLCLGCRACETACPSGVPFGHLLEA